MESKRIRTRTYTMTGIALMAAIMCMIGPISIPIGVVPITLTDFVIYSSVYLLGSKCGTISYIVYLMLGVFGLPVFSGYSGGIAKLAGPTGGYLIGFIFMALSSGCIIERCKYQFAISVFGLSFSTLIAYLFGTIWFVAQADCGFLYALTICVFPFLIGDFIKILIVAWICPLIRKQLSRNGLLVSKKK